MRGRELPRPSEERESWLGLSAKARTSAARQEERAWLGGLAQQRPVCCDRSRLCARLAASARAGARERRARERERRWWVSRARARERQRGRVEPKSKAVGAALERSGCRMAIAGAHARALLEVGFFLARARAVTRAAALAAHPATCCCQASSAGNEALHRLLLRALATAHTHSGRGDARAPHPLHRAAALSGHGPCCCRPCERRAYRLGVNELLAARSPVGRKLHARGLHVPRSSGRALLCAGHTRRTDASVVERE